jgi:Ca-activated chloride channel family protein
VASAQTPDEIGPLRAGRIAQQFGVRVYTIAVGSGRLDQAGEWVALDTSQVERLAQRTGGAFFEARRAESLAQVYAAIDELEKSPFVEARYRLEERFAPFVVAALLMLGLAGLLRASGLEVLP